MERITRFRAGVILLIFCLIVSFFSFKLYAMQIIEAGGKTNNTPTFETRVRVKAARGNILDTNGNILVSNRASYDLVINHYVLTSSSNPNQTLYNLIKLCDELNIKYEDNLHITKNKPYTYTLSDYNSTWQGYFQSFLIYRDNLDSDISAPLLMAKLRESYAIPEDWSDEDARLVLGLRYELSLRNCVPTLSNYVFLSDVDSDTLAAVLELNIPGMTVETSTVRQYNTQYAAHVLGYVGAMNASQWEKYKELGYSMDAMVGQSGIEEAFEEYLHGTDGTRVDIVTKDGTLLSSHYEVEPKAGQNVQVSLDLNMQTIAEDALAMTIQNLRDPLKNPSTDGRDAGGGAVVAMDVKTGQVLVSASYPTYDLANLFKDYNSLLEADGNPMFNRALQATYPPGSTYKMSATVAGIDSGTITGTTKLEDKGVFTKYSGMAPKCLKYTNSGTTHGMLDCTVALKYSCNYFFYEIGDMMGIRMMDKVAKAMGLGEYTGIELFEAQGHRANPETKAELYTGDDARWYAGDTVTAAIGQSENRFTPVQLCTYVTTLCNKGTRYKATFLDKVVTADYGTVVKGHSTTVMSEYAMTDEAFNAVMTGMKLVANEMGGTAYKVFKDYPVMVAAKTGTAQTGITGASDNGAFVCFAPADDPQIAVVVYGERAGHGSSLGQVARSVLDAYFDHANIDNVIIGENEVC
jgi:penicillin-binding protein 2